MIGSINGEITLLYDNNKDNVENIALFSKEGELLESVPAARLKNNARVADQGAGLWRLWKKQKTFIFPCLMYSTFLTQETASTVGWYLWQELWRSQDGPYTDQGVLAHRSAL